MNDEVETQGHNQKESVTQPFQRAKQICKKHKLSIGTSLHP